MNTIGVGQNILQLELADLTEIPLCSLIVKLVHRSRAALKITIIDQDQIQQNQQQHSFWQDLQA